MRAGSARATLASPATVARVGCRHLGGFPWHDSPGGHGPNMERRSTVHP